MAAAPPWPKRCPRRPARLLWGLLGSLAALSALAFLAGGGHEVLLSRALGFVRAAGGSEQPVGAPLLPADDAFLLAPRPATCAPRAPWMLVLVPSAPGHAAQRQAVRQSWGAARRAAGRSVRTVFALGLPGEPAQQAALEREAGEHGDLLQGRFADAYANLTLKTLALLGWAAGRCPDARFLVKADDDVFLNLPALARHLGQLAGPPAAYLGRVQWRVPPSRDPSSRHYVPAWLFAERAYPPYCSGPAYVLSAAAATAVLEAARHLPLLPVEDAFVGLCARRAGIAPRHLPRMAGGTRFPLDACCYREVLFSVHGVAPAQMAAMWEAGEQPCAAWQRLLGLARCKALAWLDP